MIVIIAEFAAVMVLAMLMVMVYQVLRIMYFMRSFCMLRIDVVPYGLSFEDKGDLSWNDQKKKPTYLL